ncbi:PilW family protein [Tepidibacter aestuarii]|uniref:PilW family protein n=1 Tax=Tepidibacter aestuarii TaxID=2925782 RepID=UPI0020BF46A8|nr:type II secretion system protein [Tepidibacter aestuarii]CAH2214667.1 Prepilin-type N-terminal cleavage/methylation domain-containing protein [Tepidibacter aestuarii]
MKYIYKNKGFTLIELLIVCAIAGVVISAVGSFFISNYKIFFRSEKQIRTQEQAQKSVNEIVDKVRETKGVRTVEKDSNKYLIKFKTDADDLIIRHDKTNKTLYYGRGKQANAQLASNIESFQIDSIPDSPSKYEDWIGIKINITALIDDYDVLIKDEVYFRNKSR